MIYNINRCRKLIDYLVLYHVLNSYKGQWHIQQFSLIFAILFYWWEDLVVLSDIKYNPGPTVINRLKILHDCTQRCKKLKSSIVWAQNTYVLQTKKVNGECFIYIAVKTKTFVRRKTKREKQKKKRKNERNWSNIKTSLHSIISSHRQPVMYHRW